MRWSSTWFSEEVLLSAPWLILSRSPCAHPAYAVTRHFPGWAQRLVSYLHNVVILPIARLLLHQLRSRTSSVVLRAFLQSVRGTFDKCCNGAVNVLRLLWILLSGSKLDGEPSSSCFHLISEQNVLFQYRKGGKYQCLAELMIHLRLSTDRGCARG